MNLFPRLWHLHARLFLSFGFGAAVALSLLALPWRVSTRVIFGWDAGVALYIALIFLVMAQGSIAKIRRRAAINDEGAIALLVLTAAASLASLASVLAEVGHSPSPYQILLGIATILLSWTFLSSEPKCNTPADLIIGTVDQDLRECCHAMLFAFVG